MKNVLIGVSKFKSKSGNECEIMIVKKEMSARSTESGSFGCEVENIFIPDKMKSTLTPDDINKEIVLDYEVSGGRAYLTGFKVMK